MPTEEAIILAGGLGTRLRSVVSDVPKPLAPVAGRPFLARLLDRLAAQGMRRVVLATGHFAAMVEASIGPRWAGMDIAYSVEVTPLGTGGALRQAVAHLRGDAVHVINGDTWLDYSPAALEAAAVNVGAPLGIALARVDDVARYGAMELRDGFVVGFREKGESGAGWINAGCYFLTADALGELPMRQTFSFEYEVLQLRVAAHEVAALLETSDFIDIGVPEDYARAQSIFAVHP